MNAYGISAEEFHSLAIALLRAQQTRQWLLDVEQSRERTSRTSHITAAPHRFHTAGFAIALLAILLCSTRGFGQSTFGSVVGTVQDSTQALVPGAAVTLHSQDDNSDRTTTSGPNGDFQFVNLKPGRYAVISKATGFGDVKVPPFDLIPGQTARVNVVMNLQT